MLVAHHARLSGAKGASPAKALVAASRIAADRFDYATALDLATEAIEADDTADARIQRATVQLRLTHFDAAQTDAGRALSSDADARALEVAGSVATTTRTSSARRHLAMRSSSRRVVAIQRVQGQVIRARALHAMGDVPRCRRVPRRGRWPHAEGNNSGQPTSIYAFLKVHTGEIKLALNAVERVRTLPQDAVSTIYTPVHGYAAHGYALATSGRAGEALDVLERATDEARRRGLTRYESLGVNLGAWVLRNIGEPAHARESNGVALVGASEAAYRELEVYATLDPGDDSDRRGQCRRCERRARAGSRMMA